VSSNERKAGARSRAQKGQLTAEMRNEPEEEREHETYDKAGNDRKVERGVFAAVDDVAGQFSQAEGEFAAKIEESTDKNQKAAEKEERAAEFTEGIHEVILPEGANKSVVRPASITTTYLILTITTRRDIDSDK